MSSSTDYDANIRAAQYELDAAINALEQKRKTDSVTDAQAQVDLDAQKKKIEKLEEQLAKLLEKQGKNEITSPVDGVVEISVILFIFDIRACDKNLGYKMIVF